MATQYPRNLGLGARDGSMGNFTIIWQEAAKERLYAEAAVQGIDQATMKALTQHFLYELAVRRGNTAVAVRTMFQVSSVEVQNGTRDVHVYLGNLGTGSRKYDNAAVVRESLTKKSKRGGERDPQSWGVSSWATAASTAGPSAATSSTYTASASASTTTPGDSGWILDDTYNRYRRLDPITNQWEWAP
ncbi:hypothetical protein DL95DRAFT_482544 [Leptodontidium sp. 2 PMI_412]|nr:hypothetical protein DL95DRAFT_482544 [Leptodontidium sp. 2 PMI_412]